MFSELYLLTHMTDVAMNLFAKLERLLEAARGKDNGPQPLYVISPYASLTSSLTTGAAFRKESLLNLVPEIRLDTISLLGSSSSATETEAPP